MISMVYERNNPNITGMSSMSSQKKTQTHPNLSDPQVNPGTPASASVHPSGLWKSCNKASVLTFTAWLLMGCYWAGVFFLGANIKGKKHFFTVHYNWNKKRWEKHKTWGFLGKKETHQIKVRCICMYQYVWKYTNILYVLYVLLSNQIDIFIICSTSCGRASPHQGISRLDPYTTQDLLGKSLGIVKYSLRTEGILPIFGKKKRNEKCVNYIILMIEKMQLWQPRTHLSPLTTNLSLAPDHLAVRRHMPKPLQQCDLQLRIELRVPGDFDIGDGEYSSIAEPCSKYK